jgi:hypothetical protein
MRMDRLARGRETPDLPKFVLIGAPHTSNWDFILFLGVIFTLRERPLHGQGGDIPLANRVFLSILRRGSRGP